MRLRKGRRSGHDAFWALEGAEVQKKEPSLGGRQGPLSARGLLERGPGPSEAAESREEAPGAAAAVVARDRPGLGPLSDPSPPEGWLAG